MSTTGSSIRNSVLKHWRNSSISLGRSGSKREKSDKAAKRQSVQVITTTAGTKSPEPQEEAPAPAVKTEQEQTNDSAATPNGVAPETKIVSLHVTVHIAPENVDKFLVAFKAIFDLVAAEPECLFFEVYRSVEEPGKISWVENWYDITHYIRL